jgi:hypothetical protein
MNLPPRRVRAPILHQDVETNLLITLVSFAGSVALTRLFLELTGYPQLGGGSLHIAHVLWGGLLLFASSLLMLALANRWVYRLAAMLSGVGVGLFIDELGKFITANNDYFYPSAAPIIYAVFMLTVLLYLRLRRQRIYSARAELYAILQDLEEVLDHDLSEAERKIIIARLEVVTQEAISPDIRLLAQNLLAFATNSTLLIVPHQPNYVERIQQGYLAFEQRHLSQKRMHWILLIGLIIWGVMELSGVFAFVGALLQPGAAEQLLTEIFTNRLVRSASGLNWFEVKVVLNGAIGMALIISGLLLLIRKWRVAYFYASMTLLVSLAVVNLLTFYFDQFSAIITALVQFILLMGVLRSRTRWEGKTS